MILVFGDSKEFIPRLNKVKTKTTRPRIPKTAPDSRMKMENCKSPRPKNDAPNQKSQPPTLATNTLVITRTIQSIVKLNLINLPKQPTTIKRRIK